MWNDPRPDIAGHRIVHRNGRACPVDETLLPGWVLLAQHHILLAAPAPIQLEETAVAVSFRRRLSILFPDPLAREMTMLLQLLVQSRKVGMESFPGSF